MACNCSNNTNSVSYQCTEPTCPQCSCCEAKCSCGQIGCNDNNNDASKVIYNGPNLSCLDIETGASIEEIVQATDSKVCSVAGLDYSTFDISDCLENEDGSQIATAKQFAEAASKYMCETNGTIENFITNVYNTFVTNITQQIEQAAEPGITSCNYVGIVPSDTNGQAFTKVSNRVCDIKTEINPSAASWNANGFSTGTLPTTVTAGFNTVLTYLAQVKNTIPTSVTIPTFNNVGTCLGGTLTTADTLADTVIKIRNKVCTLDFGDISILNFGCVDGAVNMRDALQNTMDRVNEFDVYQFDPTYFNVTNINNLYPCNGKNVTLNPTGLDKKVGANSSDTTPGYLSDKLQAGTNISFDYSTVPGKVVFNVPATTSDHKVTVNSSDVAPDYLDAKIDGTADSSNALSIIASANSGNNKINIVPTIDYTQLATNLANQIQSNSGLYSLWTSLICNMDCASSSRTVQLVITNTSTTQYRVRLSQNSPFANWYDSGPIATSAPLVLNSGIYTVTDTNPNPVTTLTIQNMDSGPMDVDIYVTDPSNTVVSGSSNISGQVINLAAMYTNTTFQLGTSTGTYIVHIDF